MKRGEIWTISGGADYAGKPRPAVVVQDDSFEMTDSITVSPITSHSVDAPLFRISVVPDDLNGLRIPGYVMVDKITTVRKSKVGVRVGCLGQEDLLSLDRAIAVFLGLGAAGDPAPVRKAAPGSRP